MKEEIKDNRHQRIGYVDKELNGVITVYDKYNSRLGQIKPEGHKLVAYDKYAKRMAYWDETNDYSFDPYGKRIQKGNILVSLYFQA